MTDERFKELQQAGGTGADLSPGDPLCQEAAEEITTLRMENRKLRELFPKVLEALQSGKCSSDCSLEFLSQIPEEVRLVVRRLKNELDGEILNRQAAQDKLVYRESEVKLLRERLEEVFERVDALKIGFK